eukprot:scaffold141538_cov18-Tisochrysis_lutea.AAC.2
MSQPSHGVCDWKGEGCEARNQANQLSQQAPKDKAAWQQCLGKGAEYTAQRHTGQAADPKLRSMYQARSRK